MKRTVVCIILTSFLSTSSIKCFSQLSMIDSILQDIAAKSIFLRVDSIIKNEASNLVGKREAKIIRSTRLFFEEDSHASSLLSHLGDDRQYEIRIENSFPVGVINLISGASINYQIEPNLIPFYQNVYPFITDKDLVLSIAELTELDEVGLNEILSNDITSADIYFLSLDFFLFSLLHEYAHIILKHTKEKVKLRQKVLKKKITVTKFERTRQKQELDADKWALIAIHKLSGIRLFAIENLFFYFWEPEIYLGTFGNFRSYPTSGQRIKELLKFELENYCYGKDLDLQHQHWCDLNEKVLGNYTQWDPLEEILGKYDEDKFDYDNESELDYEGSDWYKVTDTGVNWDYTTIPIQHSIGLAFLRSREAKNHVEAGLYYFEMVSDYFDTNSVVDETIDDIILPFALKSKFYAGKIYEIYKKDYAKAIKYYKQLKGHEEYLSDDYLSRLIQRLESYD